VPPSRGAGPHLLRRRSFTELACARCLLIVAGGLVYSAGAAVYPLSPPRPGTGGLRLPRGLHLLVIAGVAAHFLAISLFALPTG
jgi:predicted membrane channel-forming protein YqfA (hemolysin III family)